MRWSSPQERCVTWKAAMSRYRERQPRNVYSINYKMVMEISFERRMRKHKLFVTGQAEVQPMERRHGQVHED